MIFQLVLIYFPRWCSGSVRQELPQRNTAVPRNALRHFLLLAPVRASVELSIRFDLLRGWCSSAAWLPVGTVALVACSAGEHVRREIDAKACRAVASAAGTCWHRHHHVACVGGYVPCSSRLPSCCSAGELLMEGLVRGVHVRGLLLYSMVVPPSAQRRDYDYIVVHGASLSG